MTRTRGRNPKSYRRAGRGQDQTALRAGGFIADVKRRLDITLWEVTRANREVLPAEVLGSIGALKERIRDASAR